MRYTVEKCVIRMIGPIWWPAGQVCAMEKELDRFDLGNLGEWTRENVECWLTTHSGDFQHVQDFEVDFSRGSEDWVSEWKDPDSECIYMDCMYPHEE